MTDGPPAEISLVSELPGVSCVLENPVTEQGTNSLPKKVTKTGHGRSHGTRRNLSSHLVQRIKLYDYTTTVSLLLRKTVRLPMENSSSS